MSQGDLIMLARATAQSHHLFEHIVCGIVEQESSWLPWLNRYEPEFEASPRYAPVIKAEDIEFIKTLHYTMTIQTELKNRCTSWGLMQVMGQSAREIGYSDFLPMLCDPTEGLEWGCRLFERKLAHTQGSMVQALELYNGGANPNYAAEVLSKAAKYQT
jgi:hypothetical protein